MFDFYTKVLYTKVNVSVRDMLVKKDFISKLTIKSEASNSQTSLGNEKESVVVYSLFVKSLSNWCSAVILNRDNNIFILNSSFYISKLRKILEDTSKFKRMSIDEGKALIHLIYTEERIIRLLKSLEDQGKISEK